MTAPVTYIAWDTEAYRYKRPDDELQTLAVGAYTTDGVTSVIFTTRNQFLAKILEYCDSVPSDVYVYAHNAGYDLSLTGLKKFMIMGDNIGKFVRKDKFMLEGVIWVEYTRQHKIGDGRRRTQRLVFADSYQYLHSSLASLAHDFLGEKKYASKEDYSLAPEAWNDFIEKEGANLASDDAIKLWKIMRQYFNFLIDHDVPYSLTTSSIAFADFRSKYLHTSMYFPNDAAYLSGVLEAYRGGFTNVFEPGEFDHIIDYDFNSLYPESMYNKKMPLRYQKSVAAINVGYYKVLKARYYVIANVTFRLPDDVPVSFIVKHKNGKLYSIRAGTLFLHECEIDYLLAHGATISIGEAHLYTYSSTLFNGYIDYWYAVKKKADAEGLKALRSMSKLMMNGLYGKMGQHRNYSDIKAKEKPEVYKHPVRFEIIEDGRRRVYTDYGYFTAVRADSEPRYSVEIAGAITANARMLLAKWVETAGINNVVYCDTDSIQCKTPALAAYVGNERGQFKVEDEGEALYLAPKVYLLNGTWRFKGINIGKDIKLTPDTWLAKQFSRTKDVLHAGVRVYDRIKKMSFTNDKFKWLPVPGSTHKRAYSFTEEEIDAKK